MESCDKDGLGEHKHKVSVQLKIEKLYFGILSLRAMIVIMSNHNSKKQTSNTTIKIDVGIVPSGLIIQSITDGINAINAVTKLTEDVKKLRNSFNLSPPYNLIFSIYN